MVCPRQMVGWSPFGSRYFGYLPVGCRSMVFLCVHVGHRRAHSEIALYVCVLFVHRLAVWVSAGVGHDNTITMSGTGAQPDVGGDTPSCAQWFCEVVVDNRGRWATMVTQPIREGVGK